MDEQEILSCCMPQFAQAWKHVDEAAFLSGGFVDAICLIGYSEEGTAKVLLSQAGFNSFFEKLGEHESENFLMLVARQDRVPFIQAIERAIEQGSIEQCEVTWRVSEDGGGELATISNMLKTDVSIQCVGEKDGDKLVYLAMRNISKRRHEEHALSRNQYASFLVAMFTEAFVVDLVTGNTDVLFADATCADGKCVARVGFHETSKRVHPDDRKLFWANSNSRNIKRVLFSEEPESLLTFDLRRMEDDGEYHWVSFFISRVASLHDNMSVLVCVRNLDAQKEAQRRERELRSKAETDGLTGVYNRRATEELISAALEARSPDTYSSLIVFDVDKFKEVNDTYGHLMGDKLLKMVAKNIVGICREGDVVGRIGGDEFVALIVSEVELTSKAIGTRINKCLNGMAKFCEREGIDPPVTMSAGIVSITNEISDYKQAFAKADELMYETKQNGRNGYRLYQP